MQDFEFRVLDALGDARGLEAADRFCKACVGLLDIDAVAVSIVFDGANMGTYGASGAQARKYDELQFIVGEGPCLDPVANRAPVLVADLADPAENRWPAYGPVMIAYRIRGVYAIPVAVAGAYVGALNFFRTVPDGLAAEQIARMMIAAELAQLPLLDLLDGDFRPQSPTPTATRGQT